MQASRSKSRVLLGGVLVCAHLSFIPVFAEVYPVKPIRIVVGFTPGGVADAVGRLIAQNLIEPLGQSVTVENRGGASGAIAYDMVAKSRPDGYTLLIVGATAAVLPSLRKNLPYDLERDLTAVSLVATAPFVLAVHPSVPAQNVRQLLALARSQPGKLSYGSVGAGSPPNMMGALFNLIGKVNILHVPYQGGAANAIANASGQVEMSFLSIPSLTPLLQGNRLRALAVTSLKRTSLMPSLPSLDEAGLKGYDYTNWNGVVAPTGVSKQIIVRLNGAIGKIVNTPAMAESFKRQGMEPISDTPEEFTAFIHNEVMKNARLIKAIGLKAE